MSFEIGAFSRKVTIRICLLQHHTVTGQVISPLSVIPRRTNFDLYVEKAEWFFTADHFHGARWLSDIDLGPVSI